MSAPTLETIAHRLLAGHSSLDRITLRFNDQLIAIRSNDTALLERLGAYFRHYAVADTAAECEIIAIEAPADTFDLEFIDWAREPGKRGRKDAIRDLDGGRLVYKVRTGMLFLQSESWRIAYGPCRDNDNQVINFINAQYMNALQQGGALICHAAALTLGEQGVALAGFSGGGKSTLMLRMLELDNTRFMSNDRLFLARADDGCLAFGVPKQPRVNPGTLIANHRLAHLLPPSRRTALASLPRETLWQVEEKYDVDILDCYGADTIAESAPLNALVILNWHHTLDTPTTLTEVKIGQRRELIAAIAKSPGPFFCEANGGPFLHSPQIPDDERYIEALHGVRVFELAGGVDFDAAAALCRRALG